VLPGGSRLNACLRTPGGKVVRGQRAGHPDRPQLAGLRAADGVAVLVCYAAFAVIVRILTMRHPCGRLVTHCDIRFDFGERWI
jgi:hypothetical protein